MQKNQAIQSLLFNYTQASSKCRISRFPFWKNRRFKIICAKTYTLSLNISLPIESNLSTEAKFGSPVLYLKNKLSQASQYNTGNMFLLTFLRLDDSVLKFKLFVSDFVKKS